MRWKSVLALLIVVVAMAFGSAGASESPQECDGGPFQCTLKATQWSATHPMQAVNTDNWHKECLIVCVKVPQPMDLPRP